MEGQATCPITGKTIKFMSTASYSIWTRGLDGKPQGSWDFPVTLPQCEDSKFPALDDLSTDEIAKSRAMVQTAEYKKIQNEHSYYVLYWVLKSLGKPANAYVEALLQATWQARNDQATYRRYAGEFVVAVDEVLSSPSGEPIWWTLNLYAINILRQAGEMEAAKARLDAVLRQRTPEDKMAESFSITARMIAERNTADYAKQPRWMTKPKDGAEH